MRVSEQGVVVTNPIPLESLIKKKYRNVRDFSKKIGVTESLMSHVLHGRRKVYPWVEATITEQLDITTEQFRTMIGGQN